MVNDIYMISDIPAPSDEDLLNFERYITPLVQIVTNSKTQTPFTVGIFGAWGSGKSTLIEYLDKELEIGESMNGLEFFRIRFNPWIYREEKNLIVPLLHTIQDHLEADPKKRFIKSVKKIGSVLTRLGAALLIKTVTADLVSLKDLEEHEKAYMAEYQRAKSVIRSLRTDLKEVIGDITDNGQRGRVVFFIDDLDRCEPFQVIDLLESLKLFLEQEYCFYFLAMDEEVISRGIQIKYKDYTFASDREELIGAEYLDKLIQLPVHLYPLAPPQIQDFIQKLPLSPQITQQASVLATVMVPNPRKIKRICNLLSMNLAICSHDKGLREQIDPAILGKLVVVQVQDISLYRAIMQFPELPTYLRKVFKGKIKTTNPEFWSALGDHQEDVIKLCETYYRVGSWVERLVEGDPPFPEAAQLAPYFTMLGHPHPEVMT
jgi:hypothetical protein